MNEDIICQIHDYIKHKDDDIPLSARPVQRPFSLWAVNEIIFDLKTNYTSYPDEIIRNFIHLMDIYEDAAEIERKKLFQIARDTAKGICSYLFE